MEDILEVAILGEEQDEEIELILLNYILVDGHNLENERHIFSLEQMSDEDITLSFRFERNDIYRLRIYLGIPENVFTETNNRVNGTTALCILLKRLAYPNRLRDLSPLFGMSAQSLSQIIKTTINIIIEHRGELLINLNNLQWLDRERLQSYSQSVQEKGGAMRNCWGFIDGTARQICRPSINQEDYYSGHKRYHCVKYQSVLCPDGMIVSLKGAYPGRRHDAGIFRESGLYRELEEKAVYGAEKYALYGDQAYGVMELLLTPFAGRNPLPDYQQNFNLSMKVLRVAVEWGFQKIISQFAFVDFRKNQKLLLQDVDSLYKVAVLLTNSHTCLYGSQTATYFNTIPPTLEQYFA